MSKEATTKAVAPGSVTLRRRNMKGQTYTLTNVKCVGLLTYSLEAFLVTLNLDTDICRQHADRLRPFLELALTEKDRRDA